MVLSKASSLSNQTQSNASPSIDDPFSSQKKIPQYDLFLKLQETGDKKIRDELITSNQCLVSKLAYKYINKGMSLEHLISVGTIALITAVDNYDLSREVRFTTYAAHCILGEIKRAFRDTSWKIRVPRGLKELNAAVQKTISRLTQELKRSPTIEEIAHHLKVSQENVIEAMEASNAFQPLSLDAVLDNSDGDKSSLHDVLRSEDKNLKNCLDSYDLNNNLQKLDKREQMIIQLFYYRELSQAQIAERLGLSQMHVSRLLRKAIKKVKALLTE